MGVLSGSNCSATCGPSCMIIRAQCHPSVGPGAPAQLRAALKTGFAGQRGTRLGPQRLCFASAVVSEARAASRLDCSRDTLHIPAHGCSRLLSSCSMRLHRQLVLLESAMHMILPSTGAISRL